MFHLDAEMFWVCPNSLSVELEDANKLYDVLAAEHLMHVFNTGEGKPPDSNFVGHFYHGQMMKAIDQGKRGPIRRCYKPLPSRFWRADDIWKVGENWKDMFTTPILEKMLTRGILLDYGSTKDAKARNRSIKRREKAVKAGGVRGALSGWQSLSTKKWQMPRHKCINIKNTEYSKLYKKFADFASKFYANKIND